jgi:hypothetical protein
VDTLTLNMTTTHGGAREGAGRKSIFADKALPQSFPMHFSRAGRETLLGVMQRTGLSRNAVIATLALQWADAVAFDDPGPAFIRPKGKRRVMSIRVPPLPGSKLAAARVRTGHSYSDIGEALVTGFAPRTRFPKPRGPATPP